MTSPGTSIFLFGLLLIVTPAILYILEGPAGDDDEADLWSWLMGKTLQQHASLSASIYSGILFMAAGIALNLWEIQQ